MSSPDKLKQFFKQAELGINSDADDKVFQDILQAQQKKIKQTPAQPENIGRIIMKNPFTKLAIAAVFFIVCIIGLIMFNKTSGVVLANVLTQIKKNIAYKYQIDMTMIPQQAMSMTAVEQKIHGSVIVSKEYGTKMTQETSTTNSKETMVQETYTLQKDNVLLIILPTQQSYTRVKIDNSYIERQHKQNYNPRVMVEQMLDCKYQNLGRSTIDGIEVEGFQTNDPNYQGGIYSLAKVDVKLWMDVKTKLPVKMEMNLQMRDQKGFNISGIIHNFQWNIPVKASDFEPNIPQDYAIMSPPLIPSIIEESAIQGLKLFRDLTSKFPEKVTPDALQPQVDKLKEAQDKLQDQSKNLQEEANYKSLKTMNISMAIQGLAAFYMSLKQDKKDPAYYGDKITPGDPNQVLMRWKVSDKDYRVIFGDLKAETVTAETLADLEKALPKE